MNHADGSQAHYESIAKDRVVSRILFALTTSGSSFDFVLIADIGIKADRTQLLGLELAQLRQLLRNVEIVVGPSVMSGYRDTELRGFERQDGRQTSMFHDQRDPTERSG
jgi:hypothetical protein